MNVFKLLSLCMAVYLAGCATAPPPQTATSPDGDDALTLSASRELPRTAAPQPRRSVAPPASTTASDRVPLTPITAHQTASRSVVALAPPVDLWDRIRRGYAMPDLDTDLVRDREQWYATRPDYIFRMTERSKKYLFHIVEELELRGMPTELALLPFIESVQSQAAGRQGRGHVAIHACHRQVL